MSEDFRRQLALLPDYLGGHLEVTLIALAAGIGLSVPLAIWLTRRASWQWGSLTAVSVIQTIPSLALLALMVPALYLLGLPNFGFWPSVIALTLYSMLPIVRNTVTGITGVDPALIEAARGLGMTSGQRLMRVELPLALPVIIAGVRTATVWVVGIATLCTPVGQTSLGNYIFSGLQTQNWLAVSFGCGSAAVLAIVLDQLIGLLERAANRRSRALALLAVAGLLLVLAGGLLPTASAAWRRGSDSVEQAAPVRIGAKTFTEQYILATLLSRLIEDAGLEARKIESLGSTVVFDALLTDRIDCYVDYSGTIWANHMQRDDAADAATVLAGITTWLRNEHGITCLGALGFENAYALAMDREHAEALGIRSIEDLVRHAPSLRIGSDYEFFSRPEWETLQQTYGIRFKEQRGFDSTFMYEAVAQGEVDVITAFSSDGRIAAYDLLVLDDPRQAFPPYDAVLLVAPGAATNDDLLRLLRPLIGRFDDDAMRRANNLVDYDGRPVEEAAEQLRSGLGLVEP